MQVGFVYRPERCLGDGLRVGLHSPPHVREVAVQVVDDCPTLERGWAIVPRYGGGKWI